VGWFVRLADNQILEKKNTERERERERERGTEIKMLVFFLAMGGTGTT